MKEKKNTITHGTIDKHFMQLLLDLKKIISTKRYWAFSAVNTEMLKAYYEIGRRFVEEEQNMANN